MTIADDSVPDFSPWPKRGATRGVDLVAPGAHLQGLRVPKSYNDLNHPGRPDRQPLLPRQRDVRIGGASCPARRPCSTRCTRPRSRTGSRSCSPTAAVAINGKAQAIGGGELQLQPTLTTSPAGLGPDVARLHRDRDPRGRPRPRSPDQRRRRPDRRAGHLRPGLRLARDGRASRPTATAGRAARGTATSLVRQLVVRQQLVRQQLVRQLVVRQQLVGQLAGRATLVGQHAGPATAGRATAGRATRGPATAGRPRAGTRARARPPSRAVHSGAMDEGQAPSRSGSLRIGLTGPIGCGKSTVASWLGERAGVVVIDADQVAREVVEPGEPALDAVIARFGPEPAPGRRIARSGGPRPDRVRRSGGAPRPRGDRPSGRPSADPRGGRGRGEGRRSGRSSSRRSS